MSIKEEVLNKKSDLYLAIEIIFEKYLHPTQREQLARHIEHLVEKAIDLTQQKMIEEFKEVGEIVNFHRKGEVDEILVIRLKDVEELKSQVEKT